MELFSGLESGLALCVTLLKFLLEAIAVFCIFFGILKTGQLAINLNRHHRPNSFSAIRLEFWQIYDHRFEENFVTIQLRN